MEKLRSLGLNPNAPKSELVPLLSSQPVDALLDIRDYFFAEAASSNLVPPGDELVSRRSVRGGKPLPQKLSEDVWSLMLCLKQNSVIPRSIVKNGKRGSSYLEASRLSSQSLPTPQSIPTPPPIESIRVPPSEPPEPSVVRNVGLSGIRFDLNAMKQEMVSLKRELRALTQNKSPPKAISACHINVRPRSMSTSEQDLPNILGCPVLSASRVGHSWKVKIPRDHLYNALSSASPVSHSVHIWKNRNDNNSVHQLLVSPPSSVPQACGTLKVVSWNCRGLHNSVPYLHHLIAQDVDIIILEEHWLWPFELSHLSSIDSDFSVTAVFDQRLNATSDLRRGCGGVAILWRKSLHASPLSFTDCDRMCGLSVNLPNSYRSLNIIGVYMPSAEQPQEVYSSYLSSVEHAISQLNTQGPLLIMGDLNAHLGDRTEANTTNPRGVLWNNMLDAHSLVNVSLGPLATGTPYTYSSGGCFTLLDFTVSNIDASRGISSSCTLDEHPLNTSDHLPVLCSLNLTHIRCPPAPAFPNPFSLDWAQAVSDGSVSQFSLATDNAVRPFLNKDYSCIEDLESDILSVAENLRMDAPKCIPPKRKSPPTRKIHDRILSHLCWKSRCVFRQWKDAGRPRFGTLYDERRKCKRAVQQHLNKQRARMERKLIQQRDDMFSSNHPRRFKSMNQAKPACEKLLVNDSLITDSEDLVTIWSNHFISQGKSQSSSNESLNLIQSDVHDFESVSLSEGDHVLDTAIEVEEVEFAINRLKRNRAGGPDKLSPEHLKFSGPVFRNWLCHVFNCITQLERIPSCFKLGIVIPIYKGKGRDPLLIKSYRGITLTSVLAKVFELVLLDRISPILEDAGIPQLTQTAYRKGISCADSIFAGQEAQLKFTSEGDCIHTCFYDLTSAFDTVEFCVLLKELFHAGVKGKCWRLVKEWYTDLQSQVRVGSNLSEPFPVERGIRQGSVLSPTIFNLVIDPLLSNLRYRNMGLLINGLFLGAFAHADDIRTACTNTHDLSEQVRTVNSFVSSNGLQLCPEKCGIVTAGMSRGAMDIDLNLPAEDCMKCLGIWWSADSSSRKSVDDRICKARGAFFAHGQLGAFHGSLNPLSSRSLIESCIIPSLMYGSESWLLNSTLLHKLESFQAELGKRILKLPRFTANNVPLLALNWPTMRCRILCSKLSFLHRIRSTESDSLSAQVFKTISATDVESITLVKQCRLLESPYDQSFTDTVLTARDLHMHSLRNDIVAADRSCILQNAQNHPSQRYVLKVAQEKAWMRTWDAALDFGTEGTAASIAILKLFCKTVFSDRICPVEGCQFLIPLNISPCDHFITAHTDIEPDVSPDSIADNLIISFESSLPIGLKLVKFL